MEQILMFLKPMIEAYAGNYGVAVQIMSVIATLRMVNKPIMSLITIYVNLTPSKDDDLLPDKIKASKAYKIFVYVTDWVASIKLPSKK